MVSFILAPDIPQDLLSTTGAQAMGTAVLVLAIVVITRLLSLVASAARTRYGPKPAEAIKTTGTIGAIVLSIPALAVIWRIPYLLDFLSSLVLVDRWTAIKQLLTVAAFAVAYLTSRFLNRSIDALEDNDAITQHQSAVAYHVVDVGAVTAASALALALWGIDLGSVFIGAGAITAVVALAARETLAAVVAGFMLLLSRPFRVGDWISVNDQTGIVTDVTIFNTKLRTPGDEHVLIPNDQVTKEQYANLSENDQIRVTVEVGVDYDSDLEHVESTLETATESVEMVKDSPAPHIVATEFADSAIVFETRVWINQPSMRRIWDVKSTLIMAIKGAFDRQGITIPFPQRSHAARAERGVQVEFDASSSRSGSGPGAVSANDD